MKTYYPQIVADLRRLNSLKSSHAAKIAEGGSLATTLRRHEEQCPQFVASLRRECGNPHGRELLSGRGSASLGGAVDRGSGLDIAISVVTGESNYSYDNNGNRTMSGYVTTANNRLMDDGTYAYQYDDEGNVTRQTKKSDSSYVVYSYDNRNRKTDIIYYTSGGTKTKALRFTYDANDQMLRYELDGNGDGTYESVEKYVYNGVNVELVMDGSNNVTARYLFGADADQVLCEESGGQLNWQLADHQGSIRDVANSTAVTAHYVYDSFGNITSAAQPTRFGYTSQRWFSAAGLYYYKARWYRPYTGTFDEEDPQVFRAGDPNLRRYVGNNVVNLTDTSGMCATKAYTGSSLSLTPNYSTSTSYSIPSPTFSTSLTLDPIGRSAVSYATPSVSSSLTSLSSAISTSSIGSSGLFHTDQSFARLDNLASSMGMYSTPASASLTGVGSSLSSYVSSATSGLRGSPSFEMGAALKGQSVNYGYTPQVRQWQDVSYQSPSMSTIQAAPKPGVLEYARGALGIINNGTANVVDGLIDGVTGAAYNLTHSRDERPGLFQDQNPWRLNAMHQFGDWWGSTDLSSSYRAYGVAGTDYGVKGATFVNGLVLTQTAVNAVQPVFTPMNVGLSGPVTFRLPRSGATSAEITQIRAYVAGANDALDAGVLSPTGRVSTAGVLREAATDAANAERVRAAAAGTPYTGHVGHVPDTTWTGTAQPYSWLDLSPRVNTSLGSQAAKYPVGYRPTQFILEEPR